MPNLILVDEEDNEIGTEEKLKVHIEGMLHRAFSILIYNSNGEMLIHKRAKDKYHCGGLWTNTCCSHQKQRDSLKKDIHGRLIEELGFDCELKKIFKFHYKKEFENGLIENEIDYVFVGVYDGKVIPNPKEVEDYKWVNIGWLKKDVLINPDKYTFWFKEIMKRV